LLTGSRNRFHHGGMGKDVASCLPLPAPTASIRLRER
jgi:hypothetical protein